jgi:hypothetical protein
VETLGRPSSPLFTVAANLAAREASPAVAAALVGVLDARDHEGQSAAEAARAAIDAEAISMNDARRGETAGGDRDYRVLSVSQSPPPMFVVARSGIESMWGGILRCLIASQGSGVSLGPGT